MMIDDVNHLTSECLMLMNEHQTEASKRKASNVFVGLGGQSSAFQGIINRLCCINRPDPGPRL